MVGCHLFHGDGGRAFGKMVAPAAGRKSMCGASGRCRGSEYYLAGDINTEVVDTVGWMKDGGLGNAVVCRRIQEVHVEESRLRMGSITEWGATLPTSAWTDAVIPGGLP